jgi:hypothetical protein
MTIKQLSVFLENKTGRINDVTKTLAKYDINMHAFSMAESTDFGILRLIVSDVEKAVEVLRAENFAVMGFYPACPGDVNYTLTSPLFDKVTIKLNPDYYKKGELVIGTNRTHADEIYIQEVKAGSKKLNGYFISHDELVNAGSIEYKLKATNK